MHDSLTSSFSNLTRPSFPLLMSSYASISEKVDNKFGWNKGERESLSQREVVEEVPVTENQEQKVKEVSSLKILGKALQPGLKITKHII